MPTISVVVPVYNAEAFLRRCIDSVLSQTYKDFELILIDDGSTDGCPAVCDEYAQKYTRISVFHQPNQGQAAARNAGVVKARGEWISFVDADDMIHPQMLELLYNGMVSTGAKISLCGTREATSFAGMVFDDVAAEFERLQVTDGVIRQLIESDTCRYWGPCAKLIEKAILLKYPFTVGRIYEDSAVTCKWLDCAQILANCDEDLYFYQINPNGTTKSSFTLKKLDQVWSYEEQLLFYENLGYVETIDVLCRRYLVVLCDCYVNLKRHLKRNDLARDIRKKIKYVYKNHRHILHMTKYEKDYCLSALYPKVMKMIWKCQAVLRR